jgi:hypothetical protein
MVLLPFQRFSCGSAVRLLLLLCLPLYLGGCAIAAGPAFSSGGSVKIAEQAARMGQLNRENALTGIGYAVVSIQNHSNPEQQRLLAIRTSKLDAYRSLAEQVYGQYVYANTTIGDLTLMDDRFRARVEGVIFGAHLVSIEPVGEDSYQTTLRLDQRTVSDLRSLYLQHFFAGSSGT